MQKALLLIFSQQPKPGQVIAVKVMFSLFDGQKTFKSTTPQLSTESIDWLITEFSICIKANQSLDATVITARLIRCLKSFSTVALFCRWKVSPIESFHQAVNAGPGNFGEKE